MRNEDLAKDYVKRAAVRIFALETLFEKQSWADVVREAQEVVELALKGFLRAQNVDVPRVHDVSDLVIQSAETFDAKAKEAFAKAAAISRRLRKDRELAFYGGEDLTPSDFYREDDAKEALSDARLVVKLVQKYV